MSYVLLILTFISLYALKIYYDFQKKYDYWRKKGVKSKPTLFPFGNIVEVFTGKRGISDTLQTWYDAFDEKIIGAYAISTNILVVKDPELIKLILVKDFNSFMDRGMYLDETKEPTAGLLFKLPGQRWRTMRNKLSSCFTIGKLKLMFSTITEVGEHLKDSLKEEVQRESHIKVDDICLRFTADVIASTIFGVETNSFTDRNNEFIRMAQNTFESTSRFRIVTAALQLLSPRWIHYLTVFSFKTVKQEPEEYLKKLVNQVIEHRQKNDVTRNDLMQLLIQLKNLGEVCDDDGNIKQNGNKNGALTLSEVIAQAYTFFFTGFETTSTTMYFLLYECALNQHVQTRLQQVIDEGLTKHDGNITYESILEMKYLDMVISETLRKYPVIGFLQRICVQDYVIPELNVKIDKGTRTLISIDGLHHDPRHYPDPDKFDPERFSKENGSTYHPFAYLPYGEGPKMCIGQRMAHFVVAVGVISVLKNYKLHVCDETEIPIKLNKLSYTSKPINPIILSISKRQ